MVQVDVFWSYAFGAGFAMAAWRQLLHKPAPAEGDDSTGNDENSLLGNRYFTSAVLYLAILFAPSGVVLLWAFPSWETMHVWDRGLTAWLVAAFAVTNITQGILGFWIVKRLLRSGRHYLAFLQMYIGYLLMFFILVHGWDGKGYQRFFAPTKEDFLAWKFTTIFYWLVSEVAGTLYLMGLVIVPVLLLMMSRWLYDGYRISGMDKSRYDGITRWGISKSVLKIVFVGGLGSAIAAGILIHILGWLLGLVAFGILAYMFMWRKGAYLYKLANETMLPDAEI